MIDRDDEKFLAMCHAPILAPDGSSRAARYVTDEACAEFLTGIFEKGPHLRRNRSCWGSIYEGDWKYYRRLAEADWKYYRRLAEADRKPKGLLQRILGR